MAFVCIDDLRLSPVASLILRDLLIKSKKSNVRNIQVSHAGYKRRGSTVSDATKGFLQKRGFGTTDMLEPHRVSKAWLKSKDIIFTMDRFLRRDLIYDFFASNRKEMENKILVLNDAAGINEKIRDFEDDHNSDSSGVFNLIERCCNELYLQIDKVN
ncbi:arsenate reductase/protein-tyrosine-phosphatase family protein [Candidatus Lokiarchaeum ossiferum]